MGERVRSVRRSLLAASLLLALVALLLPGVASAQFGIASFSSSFSSTQAGAHADFSTSIALNTDALGNPDGQLRDVAVKLPEGVVGNPQAIERCSLEALQRLDCTSSSQVGELGLTLMSCRGLTTTLEQSAEAGASTVTVPDAKAFCEDEANSVITIGQGPEAETARIVRIVNATTLELQAPLERAHAAGESVTHLAQPDSGSIPLFNIQPSPGHVATFAASLLVSNIYVQVNLGEDGRLSATISGATTLEALQATTLTLWGVPAAAAHSAQRCNELDFECGGDAGEPVAFMTNPTSCATSSHQSELTVTSWQGQSASSTAPVQAMAGCEKLAMAPSLAVAPSSARRDSPAGYEVQLNVPQDEAPNDLATPAIERVAVAMPTGTSLSPGLANGLQACDDTQLAEASCPDASKVGVAEVTSPLLEEPLRGALYIGTPTANEKYRVLIRVSAGATAIELHGEVVANEATGQVTTVFQQTPELPFSKLKLNFFGGAGAALANPATCGTDVASAGIASYAGQTVTPSATFTIGEDSEGGACPGASPFAPSFTAGTTNPLAGRSSPFTMAFARADGQQNLSSFTAQLPPGLLGLVSRVPLCGEPAAASGACPDASQIGTATVAAGAGTSPYDVSGPVYLTGPYDGAPYGLDIVIRVLAGPFDLGTALVRSRISVDPSSVAMTIASGAFPQTMGGIPLRLRSVSVNLSRPGFIVNPTSCARQAITATIYSSQGASSEVSAPFQVANCAGLAFAPRLIAKTDAKASQQGDGAGLDIEIVNPSSTTAAVRSVTVQMPSQLRPRLTTIQRACLLRGRSTAVAGCPPQSVVGQATVSSPVIAAPLTGPIYLVAHGGNALPSLVLRLSGEGVEVNLEGELKISSKDVISTAFKSLPDVPISSFELALPRGPHSMLGAITSLCGKQLALPYNFSDQSGTARKGTAHVAVSHCAATSSKRAGRARRKRPASATHSRPRS